MERRKDLSPKEYQRTSAVGFHAQDGQTEKPPHAATTGNTAGSGLFFCLMTSSFFPIATVNRHPRSVHRESPKCPVNWPDWARQVKKIEASREQPRDAASAYCLRAQIAGQGFCLHPGQRTQGGAFFPLAKSLAVLTREGVCGDISRPVHSSETTQGAATFFFPQSLAVFSVAVAPGNANQEAPNGLALSDTSNTPMRSRVSLSDTSAQKHGTSLAGHQEWTSTYPPRTGSTDRTARMALFYFPTTDWTS